jgi:hypothetical protein
MGQTLSVGEVSGLMMGESSNKMSFIKWNTLVSRVSFFSEHCLSELYIHDFYEFFLHRCCLGREGNGSINSSFHIF